MNIKSKKIIAAIGLLFITGVANAQSFKLNQILPSPWFGVLMGDGVSTHSPTASSAPTVNYITATSTTATSTYSHAIKAPCFSVDGNSCLSTSGFLTSYDAFTHSSAGVSATTSTMFFATTTAYNSNGTAYVDGTYYAMTDIGVNLALNTVCNGIASGTVKIAKGVVTVSSGINMPQNCTLEGEGMDATILRETVGTYIIGGGNASPDYGIVYHNYTIKNLTVDMNLINSGFSYGIVLGDVDTALIDRVKVENSGSPSKNQLFFGLNAGTSTQPARNLTVQNSVFTNNTGGYESVLFAQAKTIKFINNQINNVHAPYGLLQYGSTDVLIQGNTFTDGADLRMGHRASRIIGNTFASSSLVLTGAENTTVIGNTFDGGTGNAVSGIVLQGEYHASGSGEIGWDSPAPPYFNQVTNTTISDNNFINCSVTCINSGITTFGEIFEGTTTGFDVDSVSITGNSFKNSLWQGISLVANRATIADNIFVDNGILGTSAVKYNMVLSINNAIITGNQSYNSSTTNPYLTRDFFIDNSLSSSLVPNPIYTFRDNDFEVNSQPKYYTGTAFTDTKPSNIILNYYNNGIRSNDSFFGIGTANPTQALDIENGSALIKPDSTWNGSDIASLYLGDTNAYIQNVFGGTFTLKTNSPLDLKTGNASSDITLSPNGSTAIILKVSGNVGIGTTTPGSLLSIGNIGGINIIPNATSTWGSSANGINITNGCYAVGNSCLSLSNITGNLSSANGGTGANLSAANGWGFWTAGVQSASSSPTAPYFTASSSSATSTFQGGAQFAMSGGNVGIGTLNPTQALHISNGALLVQPDATWNGSDNANIYLGDTNSYIRSVFGGTFTLNANATLDLRTANSNSDITISPNNSTRMTFKVAGTIGVGTTTPAYQFNIFSATASQLALSAGAGIAQWAFRNAGGNLYFSTTTVAGTATTSTAALTLFNDGTIAPGGSLLAPQGLVGAPSYSFLGDTNTGIYSTGADTLDFATGGVWRMGITSAGVVGIGTTNPTEVNANSHLTITSTGSTDIVASTTDNTTLSDAIFNAYAPGSRIFIGAHGTNQVAVRSGITLGGWAELGAFNSSFGTVSGLLIDSNQNVPIAFGTNNTERMRILGNGNVLIGTTTGDISLQQIIASSTKPQLALSSGSGVSQWTFRAENDGGIDISTTTIAGSATSSTVSLGLTSGGVLKLGNYANCNGTNNALGVTSGQLLCDSLVSDSRLKKDITPIEGGLDTVLKLKPVTFFWKDLTNHNTSDPREQYGFIAQDIQPLLPSAVGESPDGYLTLDKTSLIAPIVNAIQAQEARIDNIVVGGRNAIEENGQWALLLLALGLIGWQQIQIKKLKR